MLRRPTPFKIALLSFHGQRKKDSWWSWVRTPCRVFFLRRTNCFVSNARRWVGVGDQVFTYESRSCPLMVRANGRVVKDELKTRYL